jgi:hypothetical protein
MQTADKKEAVSLRVHHLLCFFGWRGVGYTPEFTKTFAKLREDLSWETPVFLTKDYDAICASCPKVTEADCQPQAETVPYKIDVRCLKALNLVAEQLYSFGFLLEKVAMLSPVALQDICADCYWLNLGWCEQGLKTKEFYYAKRK